MESQASASELQPWKAYFPGLSFTPHRGQAECFHVAAGSRHEHPSGRECRDSSEWLAVLPTGYGKSFVATGCYLIHRQRMLVNRVLWVVSSDEQRKQLCPEPEDVEADPSLKPVSDIALRDFGITLLDTYRADGTGSSLRMHFENKAEVFIATYQGIARSDGYFRDLLDSAHGRWKWLIIADEAHRLGAEQAWAKSLHSLPRAEILYMTATPIRTDGAPLHGVPARSLENGKRTYDACVDVTMRQAIDEGAIRQPRAHAQEWKLKLRDKRGKLVEMTSSDLLKAAKPKSEDGKDIDRYLAKKELRFDADYLDRILTDALRCLSEKRAQWPGTHQMIIHAMSCGHAKFIANEALRGLIAADWVGVTRSDKENRDVLVKYRRGEIAVLVHVDKAGEGFNNPPTDVAVFLNTINSPSKLYQFLGRSGRRMWSIPVHKDINDIFADTGHDIISIVKELEPADDAYGDIPRDRDPSGEGAWPEIPFLSEIEAQWLSTVIISPDGLGYPDDIMESASRHKLDPEVVSQIFREALGQADYGVPEPRSERGRQAFYQEQVKRAMSALTSHIMSIKYPNGGIPNPGKVAGAIQRGINTRWVQVSRLHHDDMLADDFRAKHEWIRQTDIELNKTRRVSYWMVSGL